MGLSMTSLLEKAINKVKKLPERDQNLAAEFLLGFADADSARYRLTDAQVAEVEFAKKEVRAGKFATDEEMAELWRRFGL
jgi:hypothetical protein